MLTKYKMSTKVVNNLISRIQLEHRNGYHQHYSGIYKNGKVYYLGENSLRNCYNGECISFSTHAEMDVLQKMLKVAARTTI